MEILVNNIQKKHKKHKLMRWEQCEKNDVHFSMEFLINCNGYDINKLNLYKCVFKGIINAVYRFINS